MTRSATLIDWYPDDYVGDYFEELDEPFPDRTVYGYRSCAFRIEYGVKVSATTGVPLQELADDFDLFNDSAGDADCKKCGESKLTWHPTGACAA